MLAQQQPVPVKAVEPLRGVMEKAIGKQREAVRKQWGATAEGDGAWFVVPWPKEVEPVEPPATSPPATKTSFWQPPCEAVPQDQLDRSIRDAATREKLPPEVLREVIRKESAFYPCAVSGKGAMGLMQLMPATAVEMGVRDPFDPLESINAGAKFLGQLLTKYEGDWKKALAAYNAGPRKVDEYGGVPPYQETLNFVEKVLDGAQK